MRAHTLLIGFVLTSFGFALNLQAQSGVGAVTRDANALSLLTQVLSGAGGVDRLLTVKDFAEEGKITFYWTDEEVVGSFKAKGRGMAQFRLDSSLPNGNKSIVLNNGSGSTAETDGTRKTFSNPSIVGLTYLTSPTLYIARILRDSAYGVQYLGLETKYGSQTHHIRIQKSLTSDADPGGDLSQATRKDIFVKDSDKTVLAITGPIQSEDRPWEEFQHEVVFSDYRQVNGVLMPFSIVEFSAGQRTFSIEINQARINTGLSDVDFASQDLTSQYQLGSPKTRLSGEGQ